MQDLESTESGMSYGHTLPINTANNAFNPATSTNFSQHRLLSSLSV
jgi:hypothetical protein